MFFQVLILQNVSTSVKLILLLTVLSLAPRYINFNDEFYENYYRFIVCSTSLATQQMPPNQVLIGLALFLTFFIMAPIFNEVYEEALTPLFAEEITLDEAYEEASTSFKRIYGKAYEAKGFSIIFELYEMRKA